MTITRSEQISTASGLVPTEIEMRGNVTDDDVDHLLACLERVVGRSDKPVQGFEVLLTVRHDRDAGAQARARVVTTGADDHETEHEVYAGALRNAISEIEIRLTDPHH